MFLIIIVIINVRMNGYLLIEVLKLRVQRTRGEYSFLFLGGCSPSVFLGGQMRVPKAPERERRKREAPHN